MPITRSNHYVPRLYLKQFADVDGLVQRYRILVSNESVPSWKRSHIAGIGYQENLYTRALPDGDSDEIEQWLSKDFESPAEDVISRLTSDERLSKTDYDILTRFVAAQLVRTPAFFVKNRERWIKETDQATSQALREAETRLKSGKKFEIAEETNPLLEYLPQKFTYEPSREPGKTLVRIETAVGRSTWIFAMKQILTNTIKKMNHHRWTVVRAHDDIPWFTSDDPVIQLNFRDHNNYSFDGAWGLAKSNILFPLSPTHLLFTQVSDKVPPRGSYLDRSMSVFLRKIIAEHAFRYIFAADEINEIEIMRPRHIDPKAVKQEAAEWSRWHSEQSAVERELIGGARRIHR